MTMSPDSGDKKPTVINALSKRISAIKAQSQKLAANYCAWKTPRKIVVFESDDWGGMRMPNPKTLQALSNAGLKVEGILFNRLDGLEKREDIELLLNLLTQHKDIQGNHPVFTCNMVLGNPDFCAIEESQFQCYFRESMFDSYERYHGENLRPIWDQATKSRLFQPQFHCREHLNCLMWMRDLRSGHPETRLCFQHHFFGLRTKTSSPIQKHYLAAYSAESHEELSEIQNYTTHGLELFEHMFGFRSRTFVACNYVLPRELEETLFRGEVFGIQTRIKQTVPVLERNGQRVHQRRFTGQLNRWGQCFTVRNVLFEPYQDQSADWVGSALCDIHHAFRFKTPAIISTHRINYTSAMSVQHRDQSLRSLKKLLDVIVKRWPDVEFLSTDELVELVTAE